MERRTTRLGSNKKRLSDAPSRDLWPRDRSSGDLAALRHDGFPPLPVPRPATSVAEPLNGPGREPSASESVLARHSRGRRIRPAWVTPPRPSFRSVPLQIASRSAPHRTGREQDKAGSEDGDNYPRESMQI